MITEKEMIEAIDRIARTPDGDALYRYLQGELMRVALTADGGALQTLNGRRTFAADLMGHMAKGIDESVRSYTSGSPSERAVTVARREPVVASPRTRRDRNSFPRVDSYSDDTNPDGSSDPGSGKPAG